eukprot:m.60677 g.60677  ORF g.60677 m.60677 type:complete len:65 (-) comp9518_c0_seq2:2076-2270(-)
MYVVFVVHFPVSATLESISQNEACGGAGTAMKGRPMLESQQRVPAAFRIVPSSCVVPPPHPSRQ